MKNQIKTMVLAAVSITAVATTAHAQQSLGGVYTQGDLLAGLTTSSGNDLVLNLGTESSLANGQFWDLTSLTGGTIPPNITTGVTNGTIQFGVVGDNIGPNTVFTTSAGTPSHFASQTAFNTLNTSLSGLGGDAGSGFGTPPASATGDGSWDNGTIVGGAGTWKNNFGNPNGLVGQSSVNFYSVAQGTAGAQTQLGEFTLSVGASGDDILTFSSVPEPSSVALLSSVGLIALWARGRKKLA